MEKPGIFRGSMLTAGFIAVAVILLSQYIPPIKVTDSHPATEQSAEGPAQTFLNAPTEAIPGTAVQLVYSPDSVVDLLLGNQEEESKPVVPPQEVVRYLKVLFRAIISPNAP